MPWKVAPMSEIRLAFVHHVLSLHHPVAQACRRFGISRKTGHKWLARHRRNPHAPLLDLPKRPRSSPRRKRAGASIHRLPLSSLYESGAGDAIPRSRYPVSKRGDHSSE